MRVYRCITTVWVVMLRVVGIRKGINKGRLPQNCILADCVSVRLSNAILRNDDIYMRRRHHTFEAKLRNASTLLRLGISSKLALLSP